MKRVSVAFVDVDGTLTRTNISFLFGRYLYGIGRLSFVKAFLCALLYLCHLARVLQLSLLHHLVFQMLFYGKKKTDLIALAERFVSLHEKDLLRLSMLEEIDQLKRNKVLPVLLSSSPDFLIACIAKACGGLAFQATEYRCTEDGIFSQVGIVMSGLQKSYIAQEYRTKGYTRVVACTDSLQDRPLLEVADEVIVVCPSWALLWIAQNRGWRIIPQ